MAVPRIGPRRPRRIYLAEWRESRGLSQKQLGDRLGVADMTVSRWERATSLLNTNVMAAIAEALSIEPADLYRHPDQPSADALLRNASPELRQNAVEMLEIFVRRGAK